MIRFTRAARADLDDIRDFTIATWGRDQWLRYVRRLAECTDRIAADPSVGRERDALSPGLRSLTCHSHIIFFTARGRNVTVLRLSHAARDHAALRFADDLDAP